MNSRDFIVVDVDVEREHELEKQKGMHTYTTHEEQVHNDAAWSRKDTAASALSRALGCNACSYT